MCAPALGGCDERGCVCAGLRCGVLQDAWQHPAPLHGHHSCEQLQEHGRPAGQDIQRLLEPEHPGVQEHERQGPVLRA